MADDLINSFMTGPDEDGRFGNFGGRFVSETLMPLILELEDQYENAKTDDSFWAENARSLDPLRRPPVPAVFRTASNGPLGRREDLHETG